MSYIKLFVILDKILCQVTKIEEASLNLVSPVNGNRIICWSFPILKELLNEFEEEVEQFPQRERENIKNNLLNRVLKILF